MYVCGCLDECVCTYNAPVYPNLQFVVGQVLAGHSGPVTCIAAISISNKSSSEGVPGITALIASGSADSDLIIWESKDHNGI